MKPALRAAAVTASLAVLLSSTLATTARADTTPVEAPTAAATAPTITVERESVAFATTVRPTASLGAGVRRVESAGVAGERTLAYSDGVLTGTVLSQAPVNAVVLLGTSPVLTVALPYRTTVQDTSTLVVDERVVKQPGQSGSQTLWYADGAVTASRTTRYPVDRVALRGVGRLVSRVLAYATTTKATAALYRGVQKVTRNGVNGAQTLWLSPTNTVARSQITRYPVAKIVHVGTYVAPAWLQPVGTNGSPTSPFGYRRHPISKTVKYHNGQDIGDVCGAPVRATRGGTVAASAYSGSGGHTIQVNHGKVGAVARVDSKYLHLSRRIVAKGAAVKQGQVIGYEGTTGSSTKCHLHLSMLHNNNTYVSASLYLGVTSAYKAYNPTILPR